MSWLWLKTYYQPMTATVHAAVMARNPSWNELIVDAINF